MPLISCPDCGKQISDTAPSCIGCGKVMSQSAAVHSGVVARKGGKYELIGTLIILTSMLGCTTGMVTTSNSGWLGFGAIGFIVGIVIFLYGRFF